MLNNDVSDNALATESIESVSSNSVTEPETDSEAVDSETVFGNTASEADLIEPSPTEAVPEILVLQDDSTLISELVGVNEKLTVLVLFCVVLFIWIIIQKVYRFLDSFFR